LKITPITSPANPLLKKIRGLHQRSGREKSGLFLIEGAKLVNEALKKGLAVKEVVVSESFLKAGLGASHTSDISALFVVDDKQFQSLVTTEGPCGILAVAQTPVHDLEKVFGHKSPLVVIAHGIQDPGNLGTMIRTALAARATGMILTKGTVDPHNPKVVRSAAGALFSLPLVCNLDVEQVISSVKAHGLSMVACEPAAAVPFWQVDLTVPLALLFGNEGQGFPGSILKMADKTVCIPMHEETESLNVAISAAIVLFGAVQQRLSAVPTTNP
jgi:TrmH family RNA methyltransferase